MNPRLQARLQGFRGLNTFNPWGQCDPIDASGNTVNERFMLLSTHFEGNPRYMLVGEAPGYRGCHFSGVPFTSERQIVKGECGLGSSWPRLTKRPLPMSEASATIMWGALRDLRIAHETVMWNAFPFHPFKPDEPMSNRAPTRTELLGCADIMPMVLDQFENVKVIAVGKIAADTLGFLGIDCYAHVRHPSMGGAAQFYSQLAEIVG